MKQTIFRREYQKIQSGEGRYEQGEWVKGETSVSPFFATIRPLAMDKLSPQLQGRHISSAIVIYSDDDVLAVAGEDLKGGDKVIFDDQDYLVVSREHFPTTRLRHYRYHAVRVNNAG